MSVAAATRSFDSWSGSGTAGGTVGTYPIGSARLSRVDLGIDGRVALVMASSKGIGRGIAEALAREGGRVAMASRSREAIESAAAAVDGETAAFVADTSDLDRMAELPAEVAE